jgi:hypothetical protein
MLKGRRQQHGDHREKEDAAEKRVRNRKQLRGRRRHRIHRAHAGENHGGIEPGVEPRQLTEFVVARGTQSQRHRNKSANQNAASDEPAAELATQRLARQLGHTNEYRRHIHLLLTDVVAPGVAADLCRRRTCVAVSKASLLLDRKRTAS